MNLTIDSVDDVPFLNQVFDADIALDHSTSPNFDPEESFS